MAVLVSAPPCVIHEDEHILVVNKPAGLNTHSPSPYAGEGIYEWLRNREPRWSQLAIIHRLDKATSGVMVFAKTKLANKSLTEQFTNREITKCYILLARTFPEREGLLAVDAPIVRAGEKYRIGTTGEPASTRFRVLQKEEDYYLIEAIPLTGKTHQIRVHAAEKGFPILGDPLYGGDAFPRLCLHARDLVLCDPTSGHVYDFHVEPNFFESPPFALRRLMIDQKNTTAFRLIHSSFDHAPVYVERWGAHLLGQGEAAPSESTIQVMRDAATLVDCHGAYYKLLNPQVARASQQEAAPHLLFGVAAPSAFNVQENGVKYEISFEQGYSVGLFLDQRDNRRRLLVNHIAADFPLAPSGLKGRSVLNTFAYTCGFSVCAALAGAQTTSLDLSKKYLEWGERNFRLNGLNPEEHDFIYGDVFDWAPRLQKKGRKFDVIILDPPTFSRSKERVFQAERDYGALVVAVLPLLNAGGVLFASTNAHKLAPEEFVRKVEAAIKQAEREVVQRHYVPQPIDFPISKEEPAYLKTLWLRVG
jgi:23S rRNA (cytosine1962-C5)-methyltransferase